MYIDIVIDCMVPTCIKWQLHFITLTLCNRIIIYLSKLFLPLICPPPPHPNTHTHTHKQTKSNKDNTKMNFQDQTTLKTILNQDSSIQIKLNPQDWNVWTISMNPPQPPPPPQPPINKSENEIMWHTVYLFLLASACLGLEYVGSVCHPVV